MKFSIKNTQEIPQMAREILQNLEHPIVGFYGNLGVGKTTLIKEMVKQSGGKQNPTSPSFSLVNEYDVKNGFIYHFDFYRLDSPDQAWDIGWEDYSSSGFPCWIEWPEKIEELLPEKMHKIYIRLIKEKREIELI